jgi:hypothetical protein
MQAKLSLEFGLPAGRRLMDKRGQPRDAAAA